MTAGQLLAVAALVLGPAASARAQEGTLLGTVRDASGAPVPGVVVTVSHPDEPQVRVAITDLHGRYEIEDADLDRAVEYRVEASHPQFRNEELRIQPGAAAAESITLERRRRCVFGRR